jgi:hypothetical protein
VRCAALLLPSYLKIIERKRKRKETGVKKKLGVICS